jgi:zinc protease
MLSIILSSDKTSRLYRAFIDTAKATDESVYTYELHDPALTISYITLAPKTSHEEAEKIVLREYEAIKEKGVTAAELASAKRSVRRLVAGRRDGAYALLSSLNEDLATGDWSRFVTLPEQLAKVTAADIKRVAKKYLVEDQSTVGWFISTSA